MTPARALELPIELQMEVLINYLLDNDYELAVAFLLDLQRQIASQPTLH